MEVGVSALRAAAVAVHGVVRLDETRAVDLQAVLALVAGACARLARVRLGADADEVPWLDAPDGLGADADGDANDLVTDDDGVLGVALEGLSVAV